MISEDYDALQTRFVQEWDHTSYPSTYDLVVLEDRSLPFVRFAVRAGASNHAAGSGDHGFKKQLGRVWLQIFVENGKGDALAIELVDAFATIFRNWRSTDGCVKCATEDVQGPYPQEDGSQMYTVSVPWKSFRPYP